MGEGLVCGGALGAVASSSTASGGAEGLEHLVAGLSVLDSLRFGDHGFTHEAFDGVLLLALLEELELAFVCLWWLFVEYLALHAHGLLHF